jgi:hypothetical protein
VTYQSWIPSFEWGPCCVAQAGLNSCSSCLGLLSAGITGVIITSLLACFFIYIFILMDLAKESKMEGKRKGQYLILPPSVLAPHLTHSVLSVKLGSCSWYSCAPPNSLPMQKKSRSEWLAVANQIQCLSVWWCTFNNILEEVKIRTVTQPCPCAHSAGTQLFLSRRRAEINLTLLGKNENATSF